MNELLAAAKAVIEATDTGDRWCAIANLSAAVERAEQGPENEPVAWLSIDGYVYRSYTVAKHSHHGQEPTPLYRHPPRQTGLDQLLERIRFLEQQIAERKNA